jgi:hypothetical protein
MTKKNETKWHKRASIQKIRKHGAQDA